MVGSIVRETGCSCVAFGTFLGPGDKMHKLQRTNGKYLCKNEERGQLTYAFPRIANSRNKLFCIWVSSSNVRFREFERVFLALGHH